MPSEQRLHPVSILFSFGKSLKAFAVPGLIVLVTAARRPGPNVELWMMLMLIPGAIAAVVRYLSFRLRYEGTELVVRSGIVFRNERHIPYARIQNLDAVQNVVHRLFGVIEVRVQTGSGTEPEATISVVPARAFDEMRQRVFARREAAADLPADGGAGAVPASPAGRTVLALSPRELFLYGFLENRGMVVIGALYGLLWEFGVLETIWGPAVDDDDRPTGVLRDAIDTIADGSSLSIAQVAFALAGIAGLLLLVRLVSMGWALVRLYGFRLSRAGDDLRTEYGLLTRVTATVPLRRIQSITVRDGPLYRVAGRVSVIADTAGGHAGEDGAGHAREWLAPLVERQAVPSLFRELEQRMPPPFEPVDARAFRRAVKPRVFAAAVLSALAAIPLGWLALGVAAVALPFAAVAARQYVAHLGWAATEEIVAFRSGWLWRSLTIAPVAKIQAVTMIETPFDRRAAMARVRVDTAGAGERSHRVDIPYLPRDAAVALHRRLAAAAASTAFRW
jgi:putative membrane protein